MLFYLLFALTIRFSRFGQIAVIGAAFLALIALRRVVGDDGGLGLRLTSPLPLEFVAGMILAAFRDKLAALSPWCALPLVLIGIALLALNLSTARTVAYGIPAVMLVAGGVIAETQARRRTLRPAAIIGGTSYALYLFHSLVVASLLPLLVGFPPIFSLPVLAVLCIAVALAIHYTVENRIDLAFKRAKRPAEGTITA